MSSTSIVPSDPELRRTRLSVRNRVLFFVVAWAIVLMPFLFWRGTWFGRGLSDKQITQYLHDDAKPRHIQHALVQVSERMGRKDTAAQQWYPELVRLASHPVEEIRNTDAWVMGQDTTRPEFQQALRDMLHDGIPSVRFNAALALVRFADSAGHNELVEMLRPAQALAPQAGRVTDVTKAGTSVRQGGVVATVDANGQKIEVRSPIAGRIHTTVERGANVAAQTEVAVLDPAAEQVWEGLRALYLVGTAEDLPAIEPFTRATANMPERVRQQAQATTEAIHQRAAK